MAKKIKIEEEKVIPTVIPEVEIKPEISKIAVDFSSEGLNNLARKVNEIIDYLNK